MRTLATVGTLLVLLVSPHAGSTEAAADEKRAPTKPLLSLHGRTSKVTKPGYHRVETAEAWAALWLKH